MLNTPPVVRSQVSEALSIISEHDFPKKWQGLLPNLIERFQNGDATTVNGVLQTLNSIYKRYRNQLGLSAKLNEELKYSQQLIVPLWETLKKLSTELQANTGDVHAAKLTLSSIRLVCRIFYSLNSPGLTEVMHLNMLCLMGVVTFDLKKCSQSAVSTISNYTEHTAACMHVLSKI